MYTINQHDIKQASIEKEPTATIEYAFLIM